MIIIILLEKKKVIIKHHAETLKNIPVSGIDAKHPVT